MESTQGVYKIQVLLKTIDLTLCIMRNHKGNASSSQQITHKRVILLFKILITREYIANLLMGNSVTKAFYVFLGCE